MSGARAMGDHDGDGGRPGHEPATAGGGSRAPRLGAVVPAMVAVLLLLTGGGYVGLTWSRAEQVCAEEVAFHADRPAPSSVDVAWSWLPLGIRCTWDDGSRTSLWWGGHDH